HRRDDLRSARRRAGELQRGLDRLRAGIAEEDPLQVWRRDREELLNERGFGGGPERGPDVQQLAGLRLDRRDDLRVRVAEVADAERRAAVDVLVPLRVKEGREEPAREREVPFRVGGELARA